MLNMNPRKKLKIKTSVPSLRDFEDKFSAAERWLMHSNPSEFKFLVCESRLEFLLMNLGVF